MADSRLPSDQFYDVLDWLEHENAYQQQKFNYEEEADKPVEYWMQQFNSYLQRIPLFGLDTLQGLQATLKLTATALALAEHIYEKTGNLPKPGVPSGEISEWSSNR